MADSKPRPMTLKEIVETKRSRDDNGTGADSPDSASFEWLGWPGRIAILLAVIIAPWMLGSVHPKSQFLLATLIAIATGSWWLVLTLNPKRQPIMPWIGILLLGGVVLGAVQLMPLTSGMASMLTGRQTEIFNEWSAVGIVGSSASTTISLNHDATWNQILLLVMCLAGLASANGLFRSQSHLLLLWGTCCVNGSALAFFGILQKLTSNGKIFWQIELTQGGSPFASFVNRNNAAGFLLLSLAATVGLINYLWIHKGSRGPELLISREIPIWRQIGTWFQIMLADLTATKLSVMLAGILIAMAIMSSLSRGGVIALFAGSMAAMLFYGMARRPQVGGLIVIPLLAAVVCLTAWVGFYDDLIVRFGEKAGGLTDMSGESGRLRSWSATIQSFPQMGWLGAGLGAYPVIHRIYSQLDETVIYEYAENQFIQSLVDGGIVAALLLLAATALAFYYAAFLLYRGSSGLTIASGTFGMFLVGSQVMAAVFDFGWYIPANGLVLSILVGALAFQSHSLAGRLRKRTPLKIELPTLLSKALALLLFAGVVLAGVSCYRNWQWDSREIANVMDLEPAAMDLAATDQHIDEMIRLKRNLGVSRSRESKYLGDLWMRSARLSYFQELLDKTPTQVLSAERRAVVEANLWEMTSPERILEQSRYLGLRVGASTANEFLDQDFVRNRLPLVSRYWLSSLRTSPLNPELQVELAVVLLILRENDLAREMLDRTALMVPGSAFVHLHSAHALMTCGYQEQASVRFKRHLELRPKHFARTVALIKGVSNRMPIPMTDQRIVRELLPNDPALLYRFANEYLGEEQELRNELLQRALKLLEGIPVSDHDKMVLKASVQLEIGMIQESIESFESALDSNPNDKDTRFRLASLLFETGNFVEAREQALRLQESSKKVPEYDKLLLKIENGLVEKMRDERDQ